MNRGAQLGFLALALLATTLVVRTTPQPGPVIDARVAAGSAQVPAPVFISASPVWDEDIQRHWWPRFVGRSGQASLQATLDNLSRSVPADQLPAALRLVIDTASPALFRSPAARDAWRSAMQHSGRDMGQAAAVLDGSLGAEVLIEPFEASPPLDPEKAWLAAIDHAGLADLPKPPRRLDMPAARAALEQAVLATGLAGVRVPVPYWEDPRHVWRLAKSIERADEQLSRATGWPSPVLGMGARVILTVGAPGDSTILHTSNGLLDMRTDFNSLAHEWFHALDYTMATALLRFPAPGSSYVSQAGDLLRMHRQGTQGYADAFARIITDVQNPPLSPSDRLSLDLAARTALRTGLAGPQSIYPTALVQGLGATDQQILSSPVGQAAPPTGSPWLHWRAQASAAQASFDRPAGLLARFQDPSPAAAYLNDDMEIMAFAFSSHVSASMDESLLAPSIERAQMASPSYRPMMIEARSLEGAWRSFFSSLRPWHEQDNAQRLDARPVPLIQDATS